MFEEQSTHRSQLQATLRPGRGPDVEGQGTYGSNGRSQGPWDQESRDSGQTGPAAPWSKQPGERLLPRSWLLLGCSLAAWLASMLSASAATTAPPSGPVATLWAPGWLNAGSRSESDFLSLEEALALAFPEARCEAATVYLSVAQRTAIEARLGQALEHGIARCYVARNAAGQVLGYAWIDTHRVRSKKETLLIAADVQGRLVSLEVLAFSEPKDYIPRRPFYAQFLGQQLGPELDFGRALGSVAGATLTAHATLSASRRALALQAELYPPPPPAKAWTFAARFAGAALVPQKTAQPPFAPPADRAPAASLAPKSTR